MDRGWQVAPPRVALAAFGRPTFDLRAGEAVLARSRDAVAALPVELAAAPPGLLTDPAAATAFGRRCAEAAPDLLVCQLTTFVDARLPVALADVLPAGVPVLLWALREPGGVGSRLSLNSLTGCNLAGHELSRRGRFFRFVLGDPGDARVGQRIAALARAAAARSWLRGFAVLVLGAAPDGFFFSSPSPEAAAALGLRIERLSLDDLFAALPAVPDGAWRGVVDGVRGQVAGLDALPPAQVERFGRLQAVVEREVAVRGAAAVAVRCWPEFFTGLGAAACSFVSALNERGVAASCEADVLGALTMGLLGRLAGTPPYLGDLAACDEERDAAVFWHCGAGAFSLAAPSAGARAGVHPNRGLGFTLEFALRPGRVTLARLGEGPGGLRLLLGEGEALDAPQRFLGTAATVRLDGPGPIGDRVARLVEGGWEPHYALAYGDVAAEMKDVAALLGLPVTAM